MQNLVIFPCLIPDSGLLARKVCGLENQCADSPGCPPAKQLLERLNQGNAEVAESCIAALEDTIIFNACMQ